MPRKKPLTPQPRGNPTHTARWHPVTRRIILSEENALRLHQIALTKAEAEALVNTVLTCWLDTKTTQGENTHAPHTL